MRFLAGLITTLALVAASPQLQAQDPVYTWVDGNGVRHYAQTPPEGVKYEVRGVRDQAVGTEATKSPEAADASPAAEQERQACERATLALEQLATEVPLQIDKDGDGTPETMSTEDRENHRRMAERAQRAYCPRAGG